VIPTLFIAIPIAVVAIVTGLVQRHDKRTIARAEALAQQHGFRLDAGAKAPPRQEFDLFDLGSAQKVSFQFWREGENDSVFRYQFTTGSGDDRRTHHRTCALVSLPYAAPHTKIGPEGFWSNLGRMVGRRDIEVESAEFNRRYRVTSDDERFAITLLDHRMLAWLLSRESGGGTVKFEIWGSWLLCISDQLELEQMFGFLDWGQNVRAHMPDVLTSLYPPRR
jgi:hypothetical protein